MIKPKIKFPSKNISVKKLNFFFHKLGLKKFISKTNYYSDGYEVTKNDLLDKKKDKNFDIRLTRHSQPPELKDLYRLYQFIVLNKRTTVLEFGCGYSSVVISKALEFNRKKNLDVKPFTRCEFPFTHFILDDSKKYLKISKKRINLFLNKPRVKYFFSKCQMTTFNGNYAHQYKFLPKVNPDFIYLDGPSPFSVEGKLNNFTVNTKDMMPMSCDILKFENFLVPGTIILVDGRNANARFLKNHFKRNWRCYEDFNSDQTVFLLNEKPLGPFNLEQIKFYQKN